MLAEFHAYINPLLKDQIKITVLRSPEKSDTGVDMATTQALSLRFLRVSQVKLLNRCIEGSSSCVCDENMLESAVNSPIDRQHYGQENDPARLAATLSYRLIKNHAFANGNK